MITRTEAGRARARAARLLKRAGIALTAEERARIEVADFGLSELPTTGLELVVYANTPRYCAKELILFPRQTCPEHRHPRVGGKPGKQETFRCRWGRVYLYLPGKKAGRIRARVPRGAERWYTVRREIRLGPGAQFTVPPGTLHWFQAGPRGAVVSEFSSTSRDDRDVFTDPRIARKTVVAR
jgi:D-lyxose ketol-isomerase